MVSAMKAGPINHAVACTPATTMTAAAAPRRMNRPRGIPPADVSGAPSPSRRGGGGTRVPGGSVGEGRPVASRALADDLARPGRPADRVDLPGAGEPVGSARWAAAGAAVAPRESAGERRPVDVPAALPGASGVVLHDSAVPVRRARPV